MRFRVLAALVLLPVLSWMDLRAQGAGRLEVDRDASEVVVVTGRAGALRFLAHDHAMVAQEWTADLALDRETPENSRAEVVIRTASLRVASPEVHKRMGLSRDLPSQDDIRDIERKMTGERILDSESHPEIRFQAERITAKDGNTFELAGSLTLRGTRREVSFPVEVEQSGEAMRFTGAFGISQRDFGIQPESLAAGLVRVADRVEIRFRVLARPVP
jgi:polyisoprenoid-binding protein YceI